MGNTTSTGNELQKRIDVILEQKRTEYRKLLVPFATFMRHRTADKQFLDELAAYWATTLSRYDIVQFAADSGEFIVEAENANGTSVIDRFPMQSQYAFEEGKLLIECLKPMLKRPSQEYRLDCEFNTIHRVIYVYAVHEKP